MSVYEKLAASNGDISNDSSVNSEYYNKAEQQLVVAMEALFTPDDVKQLRANDTEPIVEPATAPVEVAPAIDKVVEESRHDDDTTSDFEQEVQKEMERLSKQGKVRRFLGKAGVGARLFLRGSDAIDHVVSSHQSRAKERENETKWQRRRRRIGYGLGVAATAVTAGALMTLYSKSGGAAPSGGGTYTLAPAVGSGPLDIYANGFGSKNADGMIGMLGDSLSKHGNPYSVAYPAEIAPLPGSSLSWNESTALGGQGVVDAAIGSGNPSAANIIGYSEGSQAALNGANKLHEMGYSPDLTLIGTPDAAVSGFFDDSKVKAAKPIFDALGIDITNNHLPEGTTVIGKPGDIWVNGGNRPIQTQVGQALGTAFGGTHGYPGNEILNPENTSFVGPDGVTYVTVKDDLSGYGHAAKAGGLAWSPQAEAFVDAVAPEGEIGKAAPAIDQNAVLQTGADLVTDSINQALPQGVPKIDTPVVPDFIPAPAPAPAPIPAPAPVDIPSVPDFVPQQVAEQVNDVVNQVTNQAPIDIPPVPDFIPQDVVEQVNTQVQQATDLIGSLIPR